MEPSIRSSFISFQYTFIDYHPTHTVETQGHTKNKKMLSVIIKQIEEMYAKLL